MTNIHELDELIDIINEIIPDEEQEQEQEEEEEEILFILDDHVIDFLETALHLMDIYVDENPAAVTEPDFEEVFRETITDLFFIQFEEHIYSIEDIEEDIEDVLKDAFDIYFSTFYQGRCDDNSIGISAFSANDLSIKINILRSMPQPTQRTNEWYHFRHNLITASNAYKAFESQSTKNQLIYEKCQPIKSNTEEKTQMVNVNSTFHWGQKYEPLSVMIYEHLYNTKIEDFGCIQHSTHKFLGASPDGINVDVNNSAMYGRMLEIKNIVNREINGIPKKEYWIQTQLQMEVCDLDECDFLETKFVEYENSILYYNDIQQPSSTSCLSQKGEHKGIVMYFNTKEGKPHYVYKPLHLIGEEEITQWEEETLDKFEGLSMMWIKNCYWKLEILSCVLITRNKKWFNDNIDAIADIWGIIERERVTGYEHRAPIKRVKKETAIFNGGNNFSGCFLKIIKTDDA